MHLKNMHKTDLANQAGLVGVHIQGLRGTGVVYTLLGVNI